MKATLLQHLINYFSTTISLHSTFAVNITDLMTNTYISVACHLNTYYEFQLLEFRPTFVLRILLPPSLPPSPPPFLPSWGSLSLTKCVLVGVFPSSLWPKSTLKQAQAVRTHTHAHYILFWPFYTGITLLRPQSHIEDLGEFRNP